MKRVGLFLVVFAGAAVVLLVAAALYVGTYQSANASMGGMMQQMMGSQYVSGMEAPMPTYVWATIASLAALAVVGVVGVVYYLAFPEIKRSEAAPEREGGQSGPTVAEATKGESRADWSVLIRTSKPDERRVLELLAAHDGRYLQKFIVKDSGLSRLKTHRIVSRFAERGIVLAKRSGNTNEITLAPWLEKGRQGASAGP